jgi:hypothetical protein
MSRKFWSTAERCQVASGNQPSDTCNGSTTSRIECADCAVESVGSLSETCATDFASVDFTSVTTSFFALAEPVAPCAVNRMGV